MWAKRWYSKDVPSGHEAFPKGGYWWFAGAVLSGLDLLQSGKRFINWSLCLGFKVSWAGNVSSGFAYNSGLVYCMCQESECVRTLWGCLTEQRTRETCWTKSTGKRERERGRKAPFKAGLSNLSSSEPIQNLIFNLTNIAYFSLQTTTQFTSFL